MFQNVLFYEYVSIANPSSLTETHRNLTSSLNLKGKVLISEEGINGNVSGTKEDTDEYIEHLKNSFENIEFKVGKTKEHNFNKMLVKEKDEICAFRKDVNLDNKAPYIEPKQLKKLLESSEEVILLDARNIYEAELGTFEDAITPNVKVFRNLPEYIDNNLNHLKDKKIVTFCTGGIRCEKTTAYMKEKGFEDVHQLHGGILKYGEEVGSQHWKGDCFVFDERVTVDMDNVKAVHNNKTDTSSDEPAYFKKALNAD